MLGDLRASARRTQSTVVYPEAGKPVDGDSVQRTRLADTTVASKRHADQNNFAKRLSAGAPGSTSGAHRRGQGMAGKAAPSRGRGQEVVHGDEEDAGCLTGASPYLIHRRIFVFALVRALFSATRPVAALAGHGAARAQTFTSITRR